MIGPGYAFDDSVTPQRNAMLRQRLQEIVDAATGDKVATVVEVPKGEQGGTGSAAVPAQIRVKYLIHPSGKLACYRDRARVQVTPARQSSDIDLKLLQETLNNMGKSASTTTLRGFVRDYQIDWSISFNLKNLDSGKTVAFSTTTFDDKSIDCVNPGDESVVYNGALQTACFKAYQLMLKKIGLH